MSKGLVNGYEDYYINGVNKDVEGNDDDDWMEETQLVI